MLDSMPGRGHACPQRESHGPERVMATGQEELGQVGLMGQVDTAEGGS
jgi:hypothetical protein